MPALQYLDSVEKGSVSDKAGLRSGDFILEVRDGQQLSLERLESQRRIGLAVSIS